MSRLSRSIKFQTARNVILFLNNFVLFRREFYLLRLGLYSEITVQHP